MQCGVQLSFKKALCVSGWKYMMKEEHSADNFGVKQNFTFDFRILFSSHFVFKLYLIADFRLNYVTYL